MKRHFKHIIAIIFLCIITHAEIFAEIKLSAIFNDNMVLQQMSKCAIWGKASKNTKVNITTSWNQKKYSTISAADGSWKVKVSTPVAGGPYQINISDGRTLTLKNILIGEVWVCSGQSNMQMPLKGFSNQPINGALETIAFSENPQIRLFTVEKNSSLEQLDNFNGTWNLCEPQNVAEFSAVAYNFGLTLNKVLHIPIGLINISWGGTRIEPWIGEIGIKNLDFVKVPNKRPVTNLSAQTPTVIFNAMVNPMVGYQIKGVIWYQGESNTKSPSEYQKLLPVLIKDWRNAWDIGDFPFYYVQIAPYDYKRPNENSAFFREVQLKVSTTLPNIGMVSILDIGDKGVIHPPNKKQVGERLAFLALNKSYNLKGIAAESPVYKSMKFVESDIILTFDHAPLGLTSFGKGLRNFEIAGEDQTFYPANASITSEGIKVSSSLVASPLAVRYAFKDFVIGDLFGLNGLPVSSFRTDDW
ncbi:sialate O-acetylesterase [Pedobacter glucosidilyticus]|uniref:sialate O-acetylesterase n=1 Tax=Pedobacter glucosidilyticus TaxID=1122941 RepID=UPI0026F20284|nr:sialate O-acetylesterase [Pedobacter glucosidilyticus]